MIFNYWRHAFQVANPEGIEYDSLGLPCNDYPGITVFEPWVAVARQPRVILLNTLGYLIL
jgi:hypothetical protein